ncbi:hypothetical protein [Paucibacter soli]|uniref:hypothetical protein n=1 Tax=Paucibacter soli TaxID=3133433 RepID=UPI0030ADD213
MIVPPPRIPPLRYIPLPAAHARCPGVYWHASSAFLDELAAYLKGKRVLEVFAGNGYLAARLIEFGVSIRPTSKLTGHDAHERGLYTQVEELDAESAVKLYGRESDVLLMSWPTVTPAAFRAAQLWGRGRPICYIGEMTDYAAGRLGGCATDEFFAAIDVVYSFKSYRGRDGDFAVICQLR